MLYQTLNSLHIECLPDKMPDRIPVDISIIKEVEQAVHVKDISIPDVTILNEPDLVIAKVSLRPVEVVEEVKPVAVAAEGAEAAGRLKARAEGKRVKLSVKLRPVPLRLKLKPKRNRSYSQWQCFINPPSS